VQGLKQEGNCESRVLSFSIFLITDSRLGVLNLCVFNTVCCCVLLIGFYLIEKFVWYVLWSRIWLIEIVGKVMLCSCMN